MYALDAKKSVVLGDTLAASRRTCLDLADAERDYDVRNDGALGLTATVRDHDTPAVGLRELSAIRGRSQVQARLNFTGTYAWIDSEMVPIWLTLRRRPLHAFFSMAVLIRRGFVTVKSSPTI